VGDQLQGLIPAFSALIVLQFVAIERLWLFIAPCQHKNASKSLPLS
jgi:hypothetical protein